MADLKVAKVTKTVGSLANYGAPDGRMMGFFYHHMGALAKAAVIVTIVSGEKAFKGLVFECPRDTELQLYYGGGILFLPAVGLFFLGLMVNSRTWRLLHGCCRRVVRNTWYMSFMTLTKILSQAIVAPIAWLTMAFLDGKYYECMCKNRRCGFSSQPEEHGTTTGKTFSEGNLNAESQVIGWALFTGSFVLSFLALAIYRCGDRATYDQYLYIEHCKDVEAQAFDKEMKDLARDGVKENIESFLNKATKTKRDWDLVSRLPLEYYRTFGKTKELKLGFVTPLEQWAKIDTNDNPNTFGADDQS